MFPHEDATKTFFSVRAKKNINLDQGILVEIKNSIGDSSKNITNNDSREISIDRDLTLLPNPNKRLGVIQLNDDITIQFDRSSILPPPTSLLLTVKPGPFDQQHLKGVELMFHGDDGLPKAIVKAKWKSDSQMRYTTMIFSPLPRTVQDISIDAPSDQLNHITITYNGKTQLWLNAYHKLTNNIDLGRLYSITVSGDELGILSLYNRELNKHEMVEHFVENHVKNFTDDEVLI